MSEETLSEFADDLTSRDEPYPKDVVRKHSAEGAPKQEMASALMARAALRHPEAPQSAQEDSERRVGELMAKAHATRPAPGRVSVFTRIVRWVRGANR